MIKLTDILNEDENPCWKGYRQVGMKNKGGKQVPNCVPESVNEEEQLDETMLVSIADLAQRILPRDAFNIKMNSFQDAGKAKERQKSMLRDLSSFLNKFYQNYNLNVKVK